MLSLTTEVLVIGGGATGAGVAWDASLRGLDVILVDRLDLAEGTSGRFHGLLHSGGRYVVKDAPAARECIAENRILRRVAADCIEDTGGMFVTTPWDDPDYAERFVAGCAQSDVDCEEIGVAAALREEPRLNPQISRAFRVPDASMDIWKTVWAMAHGAEQRGARVLPYHEVSAIRRDGDRVVGARVRDVRAGEELEIQARVTVNATGAWAGQIAALAGIEGVRVFPGRGIMIAMNHRLVNTVINRCQLPTDGDIIVPIRTVSVIGTTDQHTDDPDDHTVAQSEVDQMLDDGEKLVPGFRQARALRVWTGVRPLFEDAKASDTDTRDVTRAHALLDHRRRDGVCGFVTITGGKVTTFRLMAQETVDAVCDMLGKQVACTTATQPLPGSEGAANYRLGERLARKEQALRDEQIICECELVPRHRLEHALATSGSTNLDDIRRRLRLGMGPCQGGFCIYRAAGIMHAAGGIDAAQADASLRAFLQERWKGVWPILYGDQLRQMRFDEWIYHGVLDVDHLPEVRAHDRITDVFDGVRTHLGAPVPRQVPQYLPCETVFPGTPGHSPNPATNSVVSPNVLRRRRYDVVVIGAGTAGLVAGARLAEAGADVCVVAKGVGSTHLAPGTIDVLGYAPARVDSPLAGIAALVAQRPDHPYALLGPVIQEALDWFIATAGRDALPGYRYVGSLEHNLLLPTAIGTLKPSALVPETMAAGDSRQLSRIALVGTPLLRDFHASLCAENLRAGGIDATAVSIELEADRADASTLGLARRFDDPAWRAGFCARLAPLIGSAEQVGLPAMLGLSDPHAAWADLESRLGRRVFEIPTLPPSVPGMRLFEILRQALLSAGGRLALGAGVVAHERDGERVVSVEAATAGSNTSYEADAFVLASGGFHSGAIALDSRWQAQELVLGLPLRGVQSETDRRFVPTYFDEQPLARAGVMVDYELRAALTSNVFVAGASLFGAVSWHEASGEGIALASGYGAAQLAAAALGQRVAA